MRSIALLFIALWSASAGAQQPSGGSPRVAPSDSGAPGVAHIVDSLAARGDTTAALELLATAIRTNRRDAESWYRRGMIHWEMARSRRAASVMRDGDAIRLLISADTSLKLAAQFAPDSARYHMAVARFNLQSGISVVRLAGRLKAEDALDVARTANDAAMVAMAADEVGYASWRMYEGTSNRVNNIDGAKIDLNALGALGGVQREKAGDYVSSLFLGTAVGSGNTDYATAVRYFEEALAADPTNLRVGRHYYMALAERNRWGELRTIAERRGNRFPTDYQSRLALGLALVRLGDTRGARLAFDTAFAFMNPAEVARLTRLTRLLRPKAYGRSAGGVRDSADYARIPEAQRASFDRMFWFMSEPFALTPENEVELEFIARVVHADFRWTNEDMAVLGADSDRGDVFVRYGPPDRVQNVLENPGVVTQIWRYNSGLTFFFSLPFSFGTARIPFGDRSWVEQLKNDRPVQWANVPLTRVLDTIPARVARFRAARDSFDVVIAARLPIDTLIRGLEIDPAPVDVGMRVFDERADAQQLRTERIETRGDSSLPAVTRNWTQRLPQGLNLVRVEALQPDSRRAARAVMLVPADSLRGFGVSDLLLADQMETRGTPSRWRDVRLTPNAGVISTGASIGLVWELYDFADSAGTSRYRVAVDVRRIDDRKSVKRLVGRLIDGLGRTFAQSTPSSASNDHLEFSFDRAVRAAPVLLEQFSVDLSEFPPGRYRLRVESRDLGTGRAASRSADLLIR